MTQPYVTQQLTVYIPEFECVLCGTRAAAKAYQFGTSGSPPPGILPGSTVASQWSEPDGWLRVRLDPDEWDKCYYCPPCTVRLREAVAALVRR